AFPARNNESQGIALLRTQCFAILPVRKQHVVERFIQRDAARHSGSIRALGNNPTSLWLNAGFFQNVFQWHARPFRIAKQTVAALDGFTGTTLMLAPAVAGALDEMNSRQGWKSSQIFQREDERPLDQTIQ